MCGIAGFLCNGDKIFLEYLNNLNNIKDVLSHRGPDDNGIWHNSNELIGFAHTRLSIKILALPDINQ